MSTRWKILGRSRLIPPPADWRQALASRLGARPRRIGPWAELALFGALACVDDAGEQTLPDAALLSLDSASGPAAVLLDTLEMSRHELPMPIGFLQSQPGQVLPVLAKHLGWSGNGRCLACRDRLAGLRLACLDADDPAVGVLAGWVEEAGEGSSVWLRALAAPAGEGRECLEAATFDTLFDPVVTHFAFAADGSLRVGRGGSA